MPVKQGVEQGDPNPTHPQVGAAKPPPKYQRIPDGALTAYGAGNLAAPVTVNDIPPYIIITNITLATQNLTVTMRAGNAQTANIAVVGETTVSIPTGSIGLIGAVNANLTYYYADAPVYSASNESVYGFQGFTGGTAPANGVWHFLAIPTTAATNISLNIGGAGATPLQAQNSVLSLILNTTFYYYLVPVTSGTTYAITGGTVQTGGWIGPA